MTRVHLTLRLRRLADVLELEPVAQAVAAAVVALHALEAEPAVTEVLRALQVEAAVLREAAAELEAVELVLDAARDKLAEVEATTSELRARLSREVPTT